jgi:GNAT superfamily N-acetyltransferase
MTALRDAGPDEATLLAALQERASLAALAHIFPPDRYPFPKEAVHARWEAAVADPSRRVVVAEVDDEPVGVACVHADWLEGLYVVPDQWGTGVADALHEWALDEARVLGSSGCHLWVLEANARARRFYERRGWRENGRTRVVPFPPNPLDVGYSLDF